MSLEFTLPHQGGDSLKKNYGKKFFLCIMRDYTILYFFSPYRTYLHPITSPTLTDHWPPPDIVFSALTLTPSIAGFLVQDRVILRPNSPLAGERNSSAECAPRGGGRKLLAMVAAVLDAVDAWGTSMRVRRWLLWIVKHCRRPLWKTV